jgi:hypothetical protein
VPVADSTGAGRIFSTKDLSSVIAFRAISLRPKFHGSQQPRVLESTSCFRLASESDTRYGLQIR